LCPLQAPPPWGSALLCSVRLAPYQRGCGLRRCGLAYPRERTAVGPKPGLAVSFIIIKMGFEPSGRVIDHVGTLGRQWVAHNGHCTCYYHITKSRKPGALQKHGHHCFSCKYLQGKVAPTTMAWAVDLSARGIPRVMFKAGDKNHRQMKVFH